MSTFSEGLTIEVGDSASPEQFHELAVLEVPEFFGGTKATYANRTTKSRNKTKTYGLGFTDGEEIALMCEKDFEDTAQDLLRVAFRDETPVNLRITFTDGTNNEVNTAPFLITSQPTTPTDPNGDGESVKQVWNLKRNDDWLES
jgi:hypothetical protein